MKKHLLKYSLFYMLLLWMIISKTFDYDRISQLQFMIYIIIIELSIIRNMDLNT